jgi:integrase
MRGILQIQPLNPLNSTNLCSLVTGTAFFRGYCRQRLQIYGRCGSLRITPHQLHLSFATLLFNAGVSILTVQHILGHRHVETTLGYARLYDGTAARDYAQAMGEIENDCFIFPDD